jgi:hypothetical protein
MHSQDNVKYHTCIGHLTTFLDAYHISVLKQHAFKASVNSNIAGIDLVRECEISIIHPGKIILRNNGDQSTLFKFDAEEHCYEFLPGEGLKITGFAGRHGSAKMELLVVPMPEEDRLPLSRFQAKIIAGLSEGKLYKEIADELEISFFDVVVNVKKIFGRIDQGIVEGETLN